MLEKPTNIAPDIATPETFLEQFGNAGFYREEQATRFMEGKIVEYGEVYGIRPVIDADIDAEGAAKVYIQKDEDKGLRVFVDEPKELITEYWQEDMRRYLLSAFIEHGYTITSFESLDRTKLDS